MASKKQLLAATTVAKQSGFCCMERRVAGSTAILDVDLTLIYVETLQNYI